MLRMLLIPLVPIFALLLKSVIEDMVADRKQKPEKAKKRPEPKLYDHEWDDDSDNDTTRD